MSKIIEPHRVISREVTNADVPRVMAEAEKMKQHIQGNCVALAHSQIDDKDPLRFFLIQTGEIIVNATIVRHVDYTVDSIEGCMTYPGAKAVVRQRWHKVDVDFQTIEEGTRLSGRMSKTFRGMQAFIMQHEIDHAEGRYCYDGTEVKMKQANAMCGCGLEQNHIGHHNNDICTGSCPRCENGAEKQETQHD